MAHKHSYPLLWLYVAITLFSTHSKAVEIVTYGETNTPMSETLAFSKDSVGIDLNELGFYKFSVAATGLVGHQTNPTPGNNQTISDLSNAQVLIEKLEGPIQLFAIAGSYSIAELSAPYVRSSKLPNDTWGYLPAGWLKIPGGENFSVLAGKLFAIGGLEGTFSYENTNIQRGLIWKQTSSVTRGVQFDYHDDNIYAGIAITDGSYSNKYNWLGAQINYEIDKTNAVTVSWNGSLSANALQTDSTPLLQNNSQISTLIYSYKSPYLTLSPYVQYSYVPERPSIGILGSASTQGIALLATYRLFPLDENGNPPHVNVSIPFRYEFIRSHGNTYTSDNDLLFGPNSSAWSATLTPTYQVGMYFARLEASYVRAINATPGAAYGYSGTANNQARFLLEAGILF
ncbi:MAG: porin [Rhodocyclaceae bacterium]|jgi:hypothetical protein|nr:porin [Rhodocyclaceae bacterium]